MTQDFFFTCMSCAGLHIITVYSSFNKIYVYFFAYYLFYTVFTRTSQKHASLYLKMNTFAYLIFKKIDAALCFCVLLIIQLLGKMRKRVGVNVC